MFQHSLTQVQDQVQVVSRGQSGAALHSYREGLTPAHQQPLSIHLPGTVSYVVLVTPQIDANHQTWKQQTNVHLLLAETRI